MREGRRDAPRRIIGRFRRLEVSSQTTGCGWSAPESRGQQPHHRLMCHSVRASAGQKSRWSAQPRRPPPSSI